MILNENGRLDENKWTVNDKLIFISIKLKSNLQLTPEEQLLWQTMPNMKPIKITSKDLQELARYEKEGDEFWQKFEKDHFPRG